MSAATHMPLKTLISHLNRNDPRNTMSPAKDTYLPAKISADNPVGTRDEDTVAAAEGLMLLRYGPGYSPGATKPLPESAWQDKEAAWILMGMSHAPSDPEDPDDDATISQRSTPEASDETINAKGEIQKPSSSGPVRKSGNGKKSSPPYSSRKSRPDPASVTRVTTTRSGRKTKESARAKESRAGT